MIDATNNPRPRQRQPFLPPLQGNRIRPYILPDTQINVPIMGDNMYNFNNSYDFNHSVNLHEISDLRALSSDEDTIPEYNSNNNVEFNRQKQLIDKLKEKYKFDGDISELSDLIIDADKIHCIKLEEEKEKRVILEQDAKYLIQDNKKLVNFKDNYLKTIENIPIDIIKEKISTNKCSICLEDKTKIGDNIILTSCFHVFHEKCLNESMRINSKCPLCRFNLKQSFYKKIEVNITCKDIGSF